MLVKFSVKNWKSFLDETVLSMVASREKQHRERVPLITQYKTRVLPIAAIYGGNASGKTNLFKALHFVRNLVVKGTLPDSLIWLEPFLLGTKNGEPTSFSFELLIKETIYEFSFSATRQSIIEEKLVQINSNSEIVLYHRYNGSPNFDRSLKEDNFLEFAFKGTRDNQLFLTNSVSQKINNFRPIYDWFKNNLILVAPDTRFDFFEYFLNEEHPLYVAMNEMLSQLDTGIAHLGSEKMPVDNFPLSEKLKIKLQENVKEDVPVRLLDGRGRNQQYVVIRKKRELEFIVKKLVSYHAKLDGTEAKFEIHQESDGSQRIIDLLPAFLEISLTASQKTYVIDEIDRSLHTLLTRKLLESYLTSCSMESRAQLLFTTHDVLLMDQNIFRRDEIWVTERNSKGISTLFSFSEYKDVRRDKDIRKSYLQGRLGGIPHILFDTSFKNRFQIEGKEHE